MGFDNSISHRLVVRFRTKKLMEKWAEFFEDEVRVGKDVIHVEQRTRKDTQ